MYCNADIFLWDRFAVYRGFWTSPVRISMRFRLRRTMARLFPIPLFCRDGSYLYVVDGGWRCTAYMYLFSLRVSWRPVVLCWFPAKSRGPGWGLVRPFGLPPRYPLFMHRRFRRYKLHIVSNSNAHNVIAV